jgi:hypothetical protein
MRPRRTSGVDNYSSQLASTGSSTGLAQLQGAVPLAVTTLKKALNSKIPLAGKVTASIAVLDLATKAAGLMSLWEQLQELQAKVKDSMARQTRAPSGRKPSPLLLSAWLQRPKWKARRMLPTAEQRTRRPGNSTPANPPSVLNGRSHRLMATPANDVENTTRPSSKADTGRT